MGGWGSDGLAVETYLEPVARLVLRGDFDSHDIDRFELALERVLDTAPTDLVVDLTGLTFLSSRGLSGLVHARSRVQRLVLRAARPSVRRTIETTGLAEFFEFEAPAD